MRRVSTLLAATVLLLPACSTAGSGFQAGSWRLGLAMDAWEDTSLNRADADQDVITADFGKILGPSSEFGLRLVSADFPASTLETGSIGPYFRWYFAPEWAVRPWAEGGISFAGADNGTNDGSGWEFSAAVGAAWYFLADLGLEAFLRTSRGNFAVEEISTTQIGIGLSYLW